LCRAEEAYLLDFQCWLDIAPAARFIAKTGALTLLAPLAVRLDARQDARALESPLRRQILTIVTEQPGIALNQIMEKVDIGWGTLYHHLTKLTQAGLIQTCAAGRRRLVYPVSGGDAAPRALGDSILRGKKARAIARCIVERPHLSVFEISEILNESTRVTYYHVKRLIETGLLTTTSKTRHSNLQPTPRLLVALAKPETPGDVDDDPVADGNGPQGLDAGSERVEISQQSSTTLVPAE
jgi:predicted transcriptional regulator